MAEAEGAGRRAEREEARRVGWTRHIGSHRPWYGLWPFL